MSSVKFSVDRELADDVLGLVTRRASHRDLRNGDVLVTLMSAAKSVIRSQPGMTEEQRAFVTHACVQALTDDNARMVAGARLPSLSPRS